MKPLQWALLAAAAIFAAAPAAAMEPKAIASAKAVKSGHGAVRISVQSQTQQWGTLHVWFLRVGGDPSRPQDLIEFERKVGVPLMGVNMIDSKPKVYSLRPGRYRLIGHGVECGSLPPENTVGCSVSHYNSYETPARRYGDPAPEFEVVAGKLTDAGEFILETPPGTPITEKEALKIAQKQPQLYRIGVRRIAKPVPEGFRALAAGPAPSVPPEFVSAIRCPARPKGAMMYLPFDC
jgi:hypothetical protein